MISENMRLKMLVSGLRWELSTWRDFHVEKIRLKGTQLEVIYTAKFSHGIKIHEGYVGGNVLEVLTCKDSEFENALNTFISNYKKCVKGCIEMSVANKTISYRLG